MDKQSFLDGLRATNRSCPGGKYWPRFFQYVIRVAPIAPKYRLLNPLILGGSIASHACKHQRLSEQLDWADDHGCLAQALRYLERLPADSWVVSDGADWNREHPWVEESAMNDMPTPIPLRADAVSAGQCGGANEILRVPRATLNAYLNTRYDVKLLASEVRRQGLRLERPTIQLRIGEKSIRLLDLHLRCMARESVFVTAFNPLGVCSTPETNQEANKELRTWISSHDFQCRKGLGIGDDPSWDPEESFLVLGASRETAASLCIQFRQNAVVYIGVDAVPTLLLHPNALLE